MKLQYKERYSFQWKGGRVQIFGKKPLKNQISVQD